MNAALKRIFKAVATFIIVFLVLGGCFMVYRTLDVRAQENAVNQQNQQLLQQLQQDAASEAGPEEDDDDIRDRFKTLYEQNNDLVGWLELGGGDLSVPVLQCHDNSYYLAHDFYGEQDVHGSIFLDYRNDLDPPDENIIIYGHNRYAPNLRDTTMFYALTRYRELDYLNAHPTFRFDTLRADGEYVIYSVMLTDTDASRGDVFEYHSTHSFADEAERDEFIEQVKARSFWTAPVEIAAEDELAMLSTCEYDFTGARLVIAARKLREGESAADFSGLYRKNPDTIMPKAWQQLYG